MSDQAEITGTSTVDETAATAALATEGKAQGDIFVKNGIKVEWIEDVDADGVGLGYYRVKVSGTARFDVVERPNDEGTLQFHSGVMKVGQDDLHDALATSCKNIANQAFRTKWNELFPPEVRERAKRETLTVVNQALRSEIDTMKLVQAELFAALSEQRAVNFDALRELGIDPAAYGMVEPETA